MELLDDGPLKSAWVGRQLGYTKRSWWQIRQGNRRLPDQKVEFLAMLLDMPIRKVQRIADGTFKEKGDG